MKPAWQQSCAKRKKTGLCNEAFFINGSVWLIFFAPAKTANVTFYVYQSYFLRHFYK